MKVVVIGDVGGQLGMFQDVLARLGVGKDYVIPEGLTVIQVGDVVRMSSSLSLDSVECAKLADRMIRTNPKQWIQLYGNHEAPIIGGPCPPQWVHEEILFNECHDIVRSWWDEGLAYFAAGIESADGEVYVVTHAGLTSGYMENHLYTKDPVIAVQRMNDIAEERLYFDNYQTGVINFGDATNQSSDFMWAATGVELLPSWSDTDMGFHQVYGHDTALISWEDPILRDPVPNRFRFELDTEQRLTSVTTPENWTFQTVDWVLKQFPNPNTSDWGMLDFEGKLFL